MRVELGGHQRSRRGANALEFALVAPLLIAGTGAEVAEELIVTVGLVSMAGLMNWPLATPSEAYGRPLLPGMAGPRTRTLG
jgi:hypothetical protein